MTDLNAVRLFVKVVEAGTFSGAARSLSLPKATVSRNVAVLEESLATRLLNRTTRKVTLTPLGEAFYREAQAGLGHLETAREIVAAASAEPAGKLRVSAPTYLGTHYLVEWTAEFLRQHPQVSVELHLTDAHTDLVAKGLDVAIRMGNLPDSGLIARRIGPVERILVASPTYLLRQRRLTSPNDLPDHDWIAMGQLRDGAAIQLEGPRGEVSIAPSIRLVVDNAEAALQAVLRDVGIALLPLGVAAQGLRSGELVRVLPQYNRPGGNLHVVFASNRHMSPALRLFIDHLVKQCGKLLESYEPLKAVDLAPLANEMRNGVGVIAKQ